jgi:hypothetical protein
MSKGDRHDVRRTVRADRREASESPAGEVFELGSRECAHDDLEIARRYPELT